MARKPGQQKRAARHKKRRAERRQQRAARPARPRGGSASARRSSRDAPLAADALAAIGYDPNRQAGGVPWRSLGEQERIDRAARYHREALAPERRPPSLERHAAMHAMVENQLALDEPPAVRRALARLISEGTSRHDALHAIGWVLTAHMRRALEAREPVDVAAYVRQLDELTVARWLERAGVSS